jgi:hypothetical protein
LRKQVGNLTSAANVGRQTDKFYQQALGSPAYSQAQGTIAAGANVAGGDIARSLASRGIGTSGVGSILPGLMSSVVGGQQANLRTQAHQGAQQQAQQAIQAQLDALMGTQGPSQTQQLFAGGLESLIPLLSQYFSQMGQGGVPRTSLGLAANQPWETPQRRLD